MLLRTPSLRISFTELPLISLLFSANVSSPQPPDKPWIYTTARAIPKHLTNQGSGYFAIVEGKNGRLYIGTAKYGENAYLVEYDPVSQQMRVVVDCMKEIGSKATGFAAQSKIHTRNNVGPSGKIYFGTKQGYADPKKGEKFTDYPGGYPMVYDPTTETTRVYPIPVPHHGIISITPDEARNVAYVSTCSDERPVDKVRTSSNLTWRRVSTRIWAKQTTSTPSSSSIAWAEPTIRYEAVTSSATIPSPTKSNG